MMMWVILTNLYITALVTRIMDRGRAYTVAKITTLYTKSLSAVPSQFNEQDIVPSYV